jgi:SAP domain-containing new25
VKPKAKLSTSMTLTQFDNGYWYATELKEFADAIGIPSAAKLRKDELEKAIKLYLTTGKVRNPTKRRPSASGVKDVELGLRLDLPVVRYTNDKETKDFLEREGQRLVPSMKRKSGVRYRFNRWREEQLTRGIALTYGDLVREYVRLNETKKPFARIAHGRFINFVSDFTAAEKGATRQDVLRAWKELKALDAPKTYRSWVTARNAARPV